MPSKSIYKSPLCSCIVCKKECSAKGIHSHYILSHNEAAKRKHKTNLELTMPIVGELLRERHLDKRKQQEIEYDKSPILCALCSKPIEFTKQTNKFCSRNCSAKYNNHRRPPRSEQSKAKTSDSVRKNGYKHKGPIRKYSIVSFCRICGVVIPHKSTKTCSKNCLSLLHSEKMKSRKRTGKNYTKRTFYTSPTAGKVYLESSWELKLARSLDENEVSWIRPKYLNYTIHGKTKSYYPDFYLPEYDVYLDPKNRYQREKDKDKLEAVVLRHQITLLLLYKEECEWSVVKQMMVEKEGFEPSRPRR